ncbi:MAG TPA: AfsR/SARP family transcriptional regulator [Actinocrinis sp.]|jgi:DNA-binding SARP family transcriptional activator
MFLSVLGPLSLTVAGRSVAPTAPQPRKVLALLAVEANRLVPVPDLLAELWPEQRPDSAKVTLQSYVVRLRKTLDGDGAAPEERPICLLTRPGGYRLNVAPGVLDLHRFEQAAARAGAARQAGDDEAAVRRYREALAVWRGQPLVDIAAGPILEPCVKRLAETLVGTTLQLIDAQLRLGQHEEVLGRLTELAARSPLDEGLHARLMIALYRSGRRLEALEAYRRMRSALGREVGLDVTPILRRLHLAVLQGDPLLDDPAANASRLADCPTG